MIELDQLNQWAETWAVFMTTRTLDSVMVFALVGTIWFFIRNRVSSQFGYLLFMLVLLKVTFPMQFSLPALIESWYPSSTIQENMTTIGELNWFNQMDSGNVEEPEAVIEATASNSAKPIEYGVPKLRWITVLMMTWGIGVLAFLLYQFWAEWKTRFMILNTEPLDQSKSPIDFCKLQKTAGIKGNIKWVTGHWVKSPVAYGYFRPMIAVPSDFVQHYSSQQIRWILLHELAHIKRGDSLVSFVQRFLQAFFFFNPLIWWTNSILDQQREYACDDAALIGSKAQPKECGEGFLGVVMQANGLPTFAPATLGMINYQTTIRRRLMRIIDSNRTNVKFMSYTMYALLALFSVAILPFSISQAAAQDFIAHTISADAPGAQRVFTADIDGDGDMDILSASWEDGKIAWYENDGASSLSFTEHIITTDAPGADSVFAADMDGDGDIDVLSASETDHKIAWYVNDGAADPSFTAKTISTSALRAITVYAADVDGDGDQDVLSASWEDHKIAWYENDGAANPTFTEKVISTTAYLAKSIFVADMDGDGDLDVLSASQWDNKIAWYENDGATDPSFSTHTITTDTDFPKSVFADDLDGDGDLDVLSASATDSKIAWYENDGTANPTFNAHTINIGDDNDAQTVFTVDMDGDGDMDVLSSSWWGINIAWYENDGAPDPSFTAQTITTEADTTNSAIAADVDGDGDMDVLAAIGRPGRIALYENTTETGIKKFLLY